MTASAHRTRARRTPPARTAASPRHDLPGGPVGGDGADAPGEDDALAELESVGSQFRYRAGQTLFWEGEPCGGIYRIESGTVALSRFGPGDTIGVVGLRHVDDTLGYLAVMTSGSHRNTALAASECRVRYIDRAGLRWLVSRSPALERHFLVELATGLGAAEEQLVALRSLSLRARIAAALLSLRSRYAVADAEGCLRFELPLSRKLLASWVGARPESLSRAIRELESDGVATFSGRRVRVDDLDDLLDELGDAVAPG